MRFGLLLSLLLAGCQSPAPAGPGLPPGFVLHYSQDFSSESCEEDFSCTDDAPWVWNTEGSLDLVGPSQYRPPHRSPLSIALVRHLRFEDFVLEADLMQTGRAYGHRDFCLFLGFENPANFYYVHLATKPDQNAHNVFLVDDAPRRPLAPISTVGVDWGTRVWHRVRLERFDGWIRVFFDDLETPLLEAYDTTHGLGYVGFGSFDDEGRVDNVRIWAEQSWARTGTIFPR